MSMQHGRGAEVVVPCPVCSGTRLPGFARRVPGIVPHLNDIHRWSREAIADWVEEQERRHQPSTPEERSHEELAQVTYA